MKTESVLKQRTIKFNFKKTDDRRFYLERLAAQANNDLLDPDLKPMDRARYYNVLVQILKLVHEMDKDDTIEDLEKRLTELEAQYNNALKFSNN
jgi:hypothetical protein